MRVQAFLVLLCVVAAAAASARQRAVNPRMMRFPMSLLATPSDPKGGPSTTDCAACSISIGLMVQSAQINEIPFEEMLEKVCDFFPTGPIHTACDYLVETYGEDVVKYVADKETPDDICVKLGVCQNSTCRIWRWPINATEDAAYIPKYRDRLTYNSNGDIENPWQWLKGLINDIANLHQPIIDLDGDRFSTEQTLRGSSWRGKDCKDTDNTIYPGRRNTTHPPSVDHNCNGIVGMAPSGQTYEEELCGGSQNYGIIIVGDSVGAHFEIPPSYLTAKDINSTTYKMTPDIWYRLENEFDIPEKSWGTGYLNSSTNEPVNSIYGNLLAHNLCNHRDYQNTGVNGARSGAESGGSQPLDKDIMRDQDNDDPVILVFEVVGNDVCHGEHTIDVYTTPYEFRQNVVAALEYFDTVLPYGSHVVFIGLADGRVLYDNLHNRTHPVGVPYSDVYEYLNCLELSPCWGWLNNNATVRNQTTARAVELTAVYNEIIANTTFEHFDMAFYDFPFLQIQQIWEAQGGQAWQLIEPIDGFHPNQIANALMGQILYQQIAADHPDWLGPPNPFNSRITQLFGDQGGY